MTMKSILLFVLAFSILIACSKNTSVTVYTDSNNSQPIQIGNQIWMSKNLNVSCYRNGDTIPEVTNPAKWANLTSGAWCYYNNDPENGAIYGKLYNWYAVNDQRGLAPIGWHIPTDNEWKILELELGMSKSDIDTIEFRGTIEGGMLKESGASHWLSPNTGATNKSGFSGLPAGYRYLDGIFYYISSGAGWWSATFENKYKGGWYRGVRTENSKIIRNTFEENVGFSVRCILD